MAPSRQNTSAFVSVTPAHRRGLNDRLPSRARVPGIPLVLRFWHHGRLPPSDHVPNRDSYDLPASGRPPSGPLEKIAVEEHFNVLAATPAGGADVDLHSLVRSMDYDTRWSALVNQRLTDFDAERLAGMDASGITTAILSHTVPGVQGIVDPASAITAAREINDRLHEVIVRHPGRFAGFASVPLQDPAAAAIEVERAVSRLGFKGVMINGYSNAGDARSGEYLDEPKFLPFWEAVTALDVPVYLHPRPALEQRLYEGCLLYTSPSPRD